MSRDETARLAPLLDARSEAGLVRRCHGDLHLGNIVLIDGHPTAFDALEFDERLATIDVLYDLAFLLMDLDVRLDRAAANVVLNAYVVAEPTGGEIDGLSALPLFPGNARARCAASWRWSRHCSGPKGETRTLIAVARSYVAAANTYLEPKPPVLVAIGGLSGTGKSTLAASLAPLIGPAPGALSLRTDIERKRMFEVPETQRLTSDHYAEQLSDDVYAVMYAKTARAHWRRATASSSTAFRPRQSSAIGSPRSPATPVPSFTASGWRPRWRRRSRVSKPDPTTLPTRTRPWCVASSTATSDP